MTARNAPDRNTLERLRRSRELRMWTSPGEESRFFGRTVQAEYRSRTARATHWNPCSCTTEHCCDRTHSTIRPPSDDPARRYEPLCLWQGSARDARVDYSLAESTGMSEPLPATERRLGRRTALTFPLGPPPQKNRSPPSDSSPERATPRGISILSRTSPVRGSTRLTSLSSASQVPCQSSPSTQVTPVTNRLDSIVRRIAPVSGST